MHRDDTARGHAGLRVEDVGLHIRSDELATIRALIAFAPGLAPLFGGVVPQFGLVLDSNGIIADLLLLAKRGADPSFRTAVEELIASGTVIPYAPAFARAEIPAKLARVSEKRRVPLARLEAAWRRYEPQLAVFDPELPPGAMDGPATRTFDPKDVPFVEVWAQLGAHAVYTRDTVIPRMRAASAPSRPTEVVQIDIVLSLREYARAASVSLQIRWGGVVLAFTGLAVARLLVDLARAVSRGVARLPKGVQMLLLAAAALLVLSPEGRTWLARVARHLRAAGGALAKVLTGPEIASVFALERDARGRAEAAWQVVAAKAPALARSPRRPLRSLIRAVCTEAAGPLALAEISAGVRRRGYASRSPGAERYLRRLVRTDPCLVQVSRGRWSVHREPRVLPAMPPALS